MRGICECSPDSKHPDSDIVLCDGRLQDCHSGNKRVQSLSDPEIVALLFGVSASRLGLRLVERPCVP